MVDEKRQTGAEIEITEEMIEAGREALIECGAFDAINSDRSPGDVVRFVLQHALCHLECPARGR